VTDPDTDIVFECLNGPDPAAGLIKAALKSGKHVITSNKACVYENLEEFLTLAKENGGSLQVEASVAGGIPFLDALLKLSRLEKLSGYEGIFNGTSNYILDSMQKNGADYASALKTAQQLGYAEADPKNDVEGIDVFYKANIANALAFKTLERADIKPAGISKISLDDIDLAKKEGKVIRHLAVSKAGDKSFGTIIAPAFLNESDYLANVPANYNAQLILAPSFDKLGYFGQGAGGSATAQAMLADAMDVLSSTIRPVEADHALRFDPSLIKENWIVRTKADANILKNADANRFADPDVYYFENRDAGLLEEVLTLDSSAMIALWRD
jgi:homoserine dehydrogenase